MKKTVVGIGGLCLLLCLKGCYWLESSPGVSEPNEVNPSASLPELSLMDYQPYGDLLQRCVYHGAVDFIKLRSQAKNLKILLNRLAVLDRAVFEKWPAADQTAFWINVFNLQTMRIVLDNYPIRGSRWLNPIYGPHSLRHIKGFKTDYKFLVMDEEFTLAEIERRFFRLPHTDPRILFALVQLSRSSPLLQKEPYEGERLNEQLDTQMRSFLAGQEGLHINRDKKLVYLSSLFKPSWYGKTIAHHFAIDRQYKDHPAHLRAVLHFISLYVNDRDKTYLQLENYTVRYRKYDWTLDDARAR